MSAYQLRETLGSGSPDQSRCSWTPSEHETHVKRICEMHIRRMGSLTHVQTSNAGQQRHQQPALGCSLDVHLPPVLLMKTLSVMSAAAWSSRSSAPACAACVSVLHAKPHCGDCCAQKDAGASDGAVLVPQSKRVIQLLILLLCCCIMRHVPSCMRVATAGTSGPPACAPAFEVKLAC